jgi:type IV pilus assembly protein PilY1
MRYPGTQREVNLRASIMTRRPSLKCLQHLLWAFLFATCAQAAQTDISTVPLETYSAPTSTDVKPNVLFVLDDSGSMDWDFMPDWACTGDSLRNSSCSSTGQDPSSTRDEYRFRNAAYNGIYYNPAINYKPPIAVGSTGATNTTTYPNQTGTSAATGAGSGATPNWKAVKDDAYGIQSTSTSNLVWDPSGATTTQPTYFYTIVPGEYCTTPSLRVCTAGNAPSTAYPYPAYIRWCNSNALTTCKAGFDASYAYVRMPSPILSIFTVAGSKSTTVSAVTVGGANIMSSGTTTASTSPSTIAAAIASKINAAFATNGGYTAYASGAVVTIGAPNLASIPSGPVISSTGTGGGTTMTFTGSGMTFAKQGTTAEKAVPGTSLLTVITSPERNSYAYPNTAAKDAHRTDCAGTTCTYNEEMTNFANWWTYYRTRMQTMKTAASNAFAALDKPADVTNNVSRFRVGYMSINNNTGHDFLNLNEFKTTQKYNWYSKLIAANPDNSTPLRAALSDAGRLYAGILDGTTYNGSTVTDPLQYSCQQNYAILSTDGFWNQGAGYKLDGSTAVGNQDAALARPLYDGGSAQLQTRTSDLQKRAINVQARTSTSTLQQRTITTQAQTSTSTLQQRAITTQAQTSTSTLQSRTGTLQIRTSSNAGNSWSSWQNTGSCTWDTSGNSRAQCQYVWGAWGNATACNENFSTGTTGTWTGNGTDCQYTAWTAYTNTASCTAVPQSPGPSYTGPAARCNSVVTNGAWTNTTSCTASATMGCQYLGWSGYSNTSSCIDVPQSPGPTYSGPATRCNSVVTNGAWTNTTSCTASATMGCQYLGWSGYSNTSSCTDVPQSPGPTYTGPATRCDSVTTNGAWITATACTASASTGCQYASWTSWSNVASCAASPQSAGPNYTGPARECQTIATTGTFDTLADVAAYYYGTDLRDPAAGSGTGTCTGPIIAPATTATDLCANNVQTFGRDVATTQHMTTFTVGLGAQGQMVFSPTYWADTAGDFYDVKVGTTTNTSAGICSWQSSGACNWPTPASDSIANIDDLWHAAINGRGSYYSASDPASLATGLASTLETISNVPKPGTAAAAATSNPNISAADNYVFSTSYKSVEWFGELVRQQIDANGNLSAVQWSAMQLLDCATTPWTATTSYVAGAVYGNGSSCYRVDTSYTSGTTFGTADSGNTTVIPGTPVTRTIYTRGTGTTLIPFQWGSLSGTQKAYFSTPYITYAAGPPSTGLSQFCASGGTCLSSTDQTAAAGSALVDFLRGVRTNESTFFRQRTHVLGDIVSSEGKYVKTPMFNYVDPGYADYKIAKSSRSGAVYVASNDGMLHAFDAATGQENWAYVPSAVLPNLYALADKNYSSQHQYFVDGTPDVGDICPSASCTAGQWKTILVGGMNRGGKSYYALDITDPASPALLWEFTDTNLGYSFGNPVITKLKDGTWVVLFSSGYNNADGLGRLYVVNANSGALIRSIPTSAGTATTPSGLGSIVGHATSPLTNNTSIAVYGGDLLGNLWRFDINGDVGAAGYDAQLIAQFKDANAFAQPITAPPTVITYNGTTIIYAGTGRFLGTSDVSDTHTQSFYAVKDTMGTATYTNIRGSSLFKSRTLSAGTCPSGDVNGFCIAGQTVRTISADPNVNATVNWSTDNGWYLDFLTGGEREVSTPALQLGTLAFTTITPARASADACGIPDTAASFLYALDYATGMAVQGSGGVSAVSLGSGLATAPTMVELPGGIVKVIVRVADGSGTGSDMGGTRVLPVPINPRSPGGTRRVSWRELPTQ